MKNNSIEKFKISLYSVVFGILVGMLILALSGVSPLVLLSSTFEGAFGNVTNFGYWITSATIPLILTGLSVGFAYKTGLFNIGAEGQFIAGSITALYVAYLLPDMPLKISFLIPLVVGVLAGMLWALLPGVLKAYFGIHEVVITIMLNWIAFYLMKGFIESFFHTSTNNLITPSIIEQNSANISNFTTTTGLNLSLIVVIIAVIIYWFIIYKTNFGYEIKAVGSSPDAARYAGVNSKKRIVQTMLIAGAFAGASGAIFALTQGNLASNAVFEGYGFNGIAAALLGQLSPIGIVLSSLMLGALSSSAPIMGMQQVPTEIVDIIIGLIILFSALGPIFYKYIQKKKSNKKVKAGGIDE